MIIRLDEIIQAVKRFRMTNPLQNSEIKVIIPTDIVWIPTGDHAVPKNIYDADFYFVIDIEVDENLKEISVVTKGIE